MMSEFERDFTIFRSTSTPYFVGLAGCFFLGYWLGRWFLNARKKSALALLGCVIGLVLSGFLKAEYQSLTLWVFFDMLGAFTLAIIANTISLYRKQAS